MELGLQLVDGIYRDMMIDSEWSIREARGFTWWGHRFAQRVTVDLPRLDNGFNVFRIRAETEMLKDIREEVDTANKIALLNAMATTSAYVWDPARATLSLVSTMYAHDDNARLAARVAKCAVAIQAADAHIKADGLAKVLRGRPNESSHPQSGRRRDPDDMLNAVAMFAEEGQQISPYGPDLENVMDTLSSLGVPTTESGFGLTAEFEFTDSSPAAVGGTGTALFQVETMTPHPQLGSGALMTLKLPPAWRAPIAAAIATRLNMAEAGDEFVRAPLLGGWCIAPDDGAVTYVAFLPTGLDAPGLLENIVVSNAVRSRWAADYLRRSAGGLTSGAA